MDCAAWLGAVSQEGRRRADRSTSAPEPGPGRYHQRDPTGGPGARRTWCDWRPEGARRAPLQRQSLSGDVPRIDNGGKSIAVLRRLSAHPAEARVCIHDDADRGGRQTCGHIGASRHKSSRSEGIVVGRDDSTRTAPDSTRQQQDDACAARDVEVVCAACREVDADDSRPVHVGSRRDSGLDSGTSSGGGGATRQGSGPEYDSSTRLRRVYAVAATGDVRHDADSDSDAGTDSDSDSDRGNREVDRTARREDDADCGESGTCRRAWPRRGAHASTGTRSCARAACIVNHTTAADARPHIVASGPDTTGASASSGCAKRPEGIPSQQVASESRRCGGPRRPDRRQCRGATPAPYARHSTGRFGMRRGALHARL